MSRDQAIAKAKHVLADIAGRGKELPPLIVTKPVNHHIDAPKPARRESKPKYDTADAFQDGMMEALNSIGTTT